MTKSKCNLTLLAGGSYRTHHIWHIVWYRTRYDPTFWRRLCRMCRHRPRSSCVSQPWPRTPVQRSVQVTLWYTVQCYIAATSCPHLAQRPLLLGVLGPVAKLPPSLAVTTSTCCGQAETWTGLFCRFHNFILIFSLKSGIQMRLTQMTT